MESTKIYISAIYNGNNILKPWRISISETICTQCCFAGGNGQTGSDQSQFPSTQLRYSNRRLERVWRKKEKERERLEIEWSTCCAITQSHGSLHRPRNRNRLCWCNKSSVWKIRGSNGFENISNHGKESCAYTCISWKMLI